MRRRELIRRLKDDRRKLRAAVWYFPTLKTQQANTERRQAMLHALENLLPEIIKKLDPTP